ncbi:hypothetical protein Tco_0776007 [Tanacetum coccineum]
MHLTGIKRYIDPISGHKIKRRNVGARLLWTNIDRQRRNVLGFQEYHSSAVEEEEHEVGTPSNKFGLVDHPQLQMTNNLNNANANGNGNGNGGGNNGYTYKGFVACGPRDFDGTGGAVALTRWIEKMESVIDNSGCLANQRVKYAASSFIGKALTWWNTQVQARGIEMC